MSPSKPAASGPSAYLGLGSNLGDRRALLADALRRLGRRGVRATAISGVYATAPVGVEDQPEFLNAAAGVETALDPRGLLEACLAVERELGRVRERRWGPRAIDLDVLWYRGCSSADPLLELPHPRLTERGFVLMPLAEIAPDLVIAGRSIADWAAAVGSAGVRRVATA